MDDPGGGAAGSPLSSVGALAVADLARGLGDAADAADAASRIIKHALDLTGARWAEMVEPRDGKPPRILASTDLTLSKALLRAGQQSPQGPELPGLRPPADSIVIDDLFADPRYPALSAVARTRLPVRSAVLHFLVVQGRYAAGLAVYDPRVGYFTPERQRTLSVLASVAGMALAGLAAFDRARELTVALDSNRSIGTAVGIVMATEQVDSEAAFRRLVGVSQGTNRKLRDVAAAVLVTGALPTG